MCVWAACLWRIGMQRKSQRMLGHHETDTEVWNERDRAGANVCMCLCQRIGRGCPSAVTLIMLCRLILLSGGNEVCLFVCVCVFELTKGLYTTFFVCLIQIWLFHGKLTLMIHQQEGGEEMCFIMWPIHYTRIQRSLLLIYIFVHALLSSVRGPGVSVFIPQAVRNSVFETPFRGHDFLIPLCLYSHGECERGVWLRSSQSWLPVTTRDELFLPPPNHCTLTVGFHLESDPFVYTFAHIKRHTTWCISIHKL